MGYLSPMSAPVAVSELHLQRLHRVVSVLRTVHRHRVIGLENISLSGRMILAVNHSFVTYDIAMLAAAVYAERGRACRALGDRLIFKIPGLREVALACGVCEGNPQNAQELLEGEELVSVAPGGMYEALRSKDERYQLRWDRRTGFCRVAMRYQTPIVLAACPKADDLYSLYDNPLTQKIYQRFRMPLPLLRGFGPTLLPQPIALTHLVSEPLMPPAWDPDPAACEEALGVFHRRVVMRMEGLMGEALKG